METRKKIKLTVTHRKRYRSSRPPSQDEFLQKINDINEKHSQERHELASRIKKLNKEMIERSFSECPEDGPAGEKGVSQQPHSSQLRTLRHAPVEVASAPVLASATHPHVPVTEMPRASGVRTYLLWLLLGVGLVFTTGAPLIICKCIDLELYPNIYQ